MNYIFLGINLCLILYIAIQKKELNELRSLVVYVYKKVCKEEYRKAEKKYIDKFGDNAE